MNYYNNKFTEYCQNFMLIQEFKNIPDTDEYEINRNPSLYRDSNFKGAYLQDFSNFNGELNHQILLVYYKSEYEFHNKQISNYMLNNIVGCYDVYYDNNYIIGIIDYNLYNKFELTKEYKEKLDIKVVTNFYAYKEIRSEKIDNYVMRFINKQETLKQYKEIEPKDFILNYE